jgi:transposase InsO family protein
VLLDLFSRYVVGWMIARTENAAFAKLLIEESVAKHGVVRVPAHDGHDSGPMADTIPTAWRTMFRPDGGHFGGRSGTLSAMISERCPP